MANVRFVVELATMIVCPRTSEDEQLSNAFHVRCKGGGRLCKFSGLFNDRRWVSRQAKAESEVGICVFCGWF